MFAVTAEKTFLIELLTSFESCAVQKIAPTLVIDLQEKVRLDFECQYSPTSTLKYALTSILTYADSESWSNHTSCNFSITFQISTLPWLL